MAEPSWIYTHQAVSNDPYCTNGSLWGMHGGATSPANQYGSHAGGAWAAGNTGSGAVHVGVIDEGVQWSHEDLAANIWVNPYGMVDGIDNDGNGYGDDIRGWDFDGNNNYDAIERANQAGILFIAAAGNGGPDGVGDNNDTKPSYPASYPNSSIIAVAAITSTGSLASYSNYGSTSVDIGAPASGIYSTLPNKNKNGYGAYSGTSTATPHVTGAAALYAARYPGAAAATIQNAILSAAVPAPSLSGKCVTGGRPNVSGF